jgi:hypothetical protein
MFLDVAFIVVAARAIRLHRTRQVLESFGFPLAALTTPRCLSKLSLAGIRTA